MSYDPSRRMPPRQERWPQATPAEAWPSYRDGEGEQAGRQGTHVQQAVGSHRRQAVPRSGVATAAFPATEDTYGIPGSYETDGYQTGSYPGDSYPGGGYTTGTDSFDGTQDGYGTAQNGYSGSGDGYAGNGNRYARNEYARNEYARNEYARNEYARNEYARNAYTGVQDGYGQAGNGYARGTAGYANAANGFDSSPASYAGTANAFDGIPEGYPSSGAYLGPGSYTETTYPDPGYAGSGYFSPGYSETGHSDPMLTAPDAGVYPDGWQEEQALRRAANHRGLLVSVATEFLAIAVVIGVSTLAAGLLRSMVSPVGAMGTIFIDRTPAVLRGFAMHHFGTHGRTVLLLGMYAVIAAVAITIGVAARRATALGVTGVAAFALVVAFVTVTRPASRGSDVMPAVIGGLAGVAALLWLVRASAPIQKVTPLRPARGGTRRRTR